MSEIKTVTVSGIDANPETGKEAKAAFVSTGYPEHYGQPTIVTVSFEGGQFNVFANPECGLTGKDLLDHARSAASAALQANTYRNGN